jgi:elongation factor Ts
MSISAKDVMSLRKSTGAGMMDCKEALKESGGDIDGALQWLAKKGAKVAAKRADREATEGIVVIVDDEANNKSLAMALSCETDFVAKNEDFIEFANTLAKLAVDTGCTTAEELRKQEIEGVTVEEKLVERTGKIGEKLEVSDLQVVSGDNIATYIHAGSKIGVLVSYKDGGNAEAPQFFRSIAMHIAAMCPTSMHPSEFDLEEVNKATEALIGQITVENEDRARLGKPLKNVPQYASKLQLTDEVMAKAEEAIKAELAAEGKPEKIWDRILPGKLERFVADNTLFDQERCLMAQFFALDDTKTVETAVKDFHADAEIVEYRRVSVG